MTWFKVDDGFYDHPKTDHLPLDALGLWLVCGTYCARHLTDGLVTFGRVERFGGTEAMADALVRSGLWITDAEGYLFNDWHAYQPTREVVLAERERERLRKAKQRESKRSPAGVPVGVPVGQPQVSQVESQVESQGVSGDPDPTRPDPTISKSMVTADAPTADPWFTEFWTAYPRKVGKAAALKAWRQATKREASSAIVDACRAMAADPNLPTDRRLIPHPTTWLNRDGWEDEPYPPNHDGKPPSGSRLFADTAALLAMPGLEIAQ